MNTMASYHLITTVLFLIAVILVSTRVHAIPYTPRYSLPLTDVSGITQNQSLQIDETNATHSVPSILASRIECFNPLPGRPPATIAGCKATLDKFKTFPLYRLVQDFQEHKYPRKPEPPPFAVYDRQCIVEVKTDNPLIFDRFSFEQVRVLALEIIEDCLDHGGIGGIAPIGRGVGWTVSAKGVRIVPATSIGNDTVSTQFKEEWVDKSGLTRVG